MSEAHQPVAIIEHAPPPARVAPIVALMQQSMAGTPDPTMLRELLAVQREYEAGEARKAYTRALAALKHELPTVIAHDSVVDFSTAKGRTYYTHASLAGVMNAITGPLTRHGFSLAWVPETSNNMITVTCRLTHSEGHFEECKLTGPSDPGSGRNALQGIASAITYLQRYSALSLLGISTADMKDPEPEGAAADSVNPERNLRAVGWLVSVGKTREDAEQFIGKKVDSWTDTDLTRLKAWGKPRSAE